MRRGSRDASLEVLQQAVTLAEPGGRDPHLRRPGPEDGLPAPATPSANGPTREYRDTLLTAFGDVQDTASLSQSSRA